MIESSSTPSTSACGNCITRRSFVANTAALAAAAAFFAACGDSGAISEPTGPVQVKVGDFAGLATVGTLVLVDDQRAVKRTGPDTFAAFSRRCTHQGSAVGLKGTGFFCDNHGAEYNNNGQVTVGPATQNLRTLVTAYNATTDLLTVG